jgi:hypothetical protein
MNSTLHSMNTNLWEVVEARCAPRGGWNDQIDTNDGNTGLLAKTWRCHHNKGIEDDNMLDDPADPDPCPDPDFDKKQQDQSVATRRDRHLFRRDGIPSFFIGLHA